MAPKPKPRLLLILLCLLSFYILTNSSLSTPSPSPASSPSSSPTPPKASPRSSSSSHSPLDPKQLTALESLNIPTSKDPCSQPSLHNATLCNSDIPFSHLTSLRFIDCSSDVQISCTALKSLTTLQDFQFINCPIPFVRFPNELSSNLHSFTYIKSLKKLTVVWLGRLRNLTHLTVTDVSITASGPTIILANMKQLKSIQSKTKNKTNKIISPTNLSSNTLSGELPEFFGDLLSLQSVSFGSNSMSGQIPGSISYMHSLMHLDLMFKIGGNSGVCFNHTTLSRKLKLGIARCDKYGFPAMIVVLIPKMTL
ncbi:hypothetical protein MKX01_016948, partial [Papaver californicum]